MNKLKFCYFMDYDDGKMARMQTTGDTEIPVNIYIDNAEDIPEDFDDFCYMDICAIGSDVRIYSSEEEYRTDGSKMAVISMIPMGTFPANPDDKNFQESPHILFTGEVLDVEWNPEAKPDEPNCCVYVKTLELCIDLYLRYDKPVEKGFIVHGTAWLYGDIQMRDDEETC